MTFAATAANSRRPTRVSIDSIRFSRLPTCVSIDSIRFSRLVSIDSIRVSRPWMASRIFWSVTICRERCYIWRNKVKSIKAQIRGQMYSFTYIVIYMYTGVTTFTKWVMVILWIVSAPGIQLCQVTWSQDEKKKLSFSNFMVQIRCKLVIIKGKLCLCPNMLDTIAVVLNWGQRIWSKVAYTNRPQTTVWDLTTGFQRVCCIWKPLLNHCSVVSIHDCVVSV